MFPIIMLFILITLLILYLLYKDYKTKEKKQIIQLEDTQENINLLQEELHHQDQLKSSYGIRMKRYTSLENILEKLNSIVLLEDIAEYLLGELFALIAQGEGNVIFYLLNREKERLEIFRSQRQNPESVIKAKEGDIFDYWVLKQTKPLLVEDTKSDFRFSIEEIDLLSNRKIGSLISSPVISRNNFLGILRIDNELTHKFNLEDLKLLSTISDIAAVAIENAILYQKTKELAIIDSLTHLYQRKYFLERLQEELLRSKQEQRPLYLMLFDIDHFKDYNDRLGHIAGDIVLKRVALILKNFTDAKQTLCCRFGGEEFLLYLFDITEEGAINNAEVLRKGVGEEKIILRKEKTSVTVSIGIAKFPDDATIIDDLIKIVDERMYKAKSEGRNRICYRS